MEARYGASEIEEKWQRIWEEEGTYEASEDPSRKKYYILEMFPYPSGKIHMGHVRNYSIGDVVARFKAMQGYNVLHPMGWDAFGLPAENAAIQNRSHPAKWTYENMDYMRVQLKKMGFSYDWSREIATCHPAYYRWEQLIFTKMFEKGLVYKKTSSVNWCENCQTVLANEQVSAEGECWRCDSKVVDKSLEQWFFKITEYAEELLEFTDKLPGWPEKVLAMQRNWIGKSLGAEIDFRVDGSDEVINVFTTRPDTLFGVTFMSLAPEHPMVNELSRGTKQEAAVGAFVAKMKATDKASRTDESKEKEGVFTGGYVINPVNGEKVPVYTANFVLMDYGTGAVMAVPAHDQRDFEFARACDIPVKVVIQPEDEILDPAAMEAAYVEPGIMAGSGRFDGMKSIDAKEAITSHLETEKAGKGTVNYRLRDWGISRQRYWGTPIPIIHCDKCGAVPVPENQLPVALPEDINFDAKTLSPLAAVESFVNTTCPTCGSAAKRETDTMDTFVESSWYYSRYASPRHALAPVDKEKADYWLPVDQYIGGVEHAVMHLLYARFFHKVLRDLGMVSGDEPFKNLLTQGMVCMESNRCEEHGWLAPEEVDEGKCIKCGKAAIAGRTEKMSKSKKNVVDPDHLIKDYGADTARLFSLFAAPPEKDLEWSEAGVEGAYRFLSKIWRLVHESLADIKSVEAFSGGIPQGDAKNLRRKTHQTIRKVTGDVGERFHFNTAISAVMELVNSMGQFKLAAEEDKAVFREAIEAVILLLAPFVPHFSEELWELLGKEGRVANTAWPEFDKAAAVEDEMTIAVQVNGKVREKLLLAAATSEEDVKAAALADEKVLRFIDGAEILKLIYVPKRLVNIVVAK
ncbi:MAG: leucine--tRNA ligase [Proteobacteria bacterium]|nr:leucine--tRNA ligase [Pseudomonadota bacterium]